MISLEAKRAFWATCRLRTTDGFAFFAAKCLKVRTKVRGRWVYVPFILNREQRAVCDRIFADMVAGRSSRIIILKSRKLGISTLVQALGYWFSSFEPGWKTQTYAHKADATLEIAQISSDFAANLPPFAAARIRATKKDGGLVWANGSSLRVFTQRSDNSSLGSTPSLLHLSEVAMWEDNRKSTDAEKPLQAVMGALETGEDQGPAEEWEDIEEEAQNQAGTIVVIESTANGARGSFHTRYDRAVKQGEKSGWTPFFFPWQHSAKHQPPLSADDVRFMAEVAELPEKDRVTRWLRAVRDYPGASDADESALTWAKRAVEFGLTPPQVRWALERVDDAAGDLAQFDQKYPLSADLAFLTSGRRIISDAITKLIVEPEIPRPIRSGLLVSAPPNPDALAQLLASTTMGSDWTFWHAPERTHSDRYLVVTDASGGVGSDFASIRVMDRLHRREVAEFYANDVPPDELAAQSEMVGWLYGLPGAPALIADEINNHGVAVVAQRMRTKYPNTYRRQPGHPANVPNRDEEWTKTFGWETNRANRPQILTNLMAALRTLVRPEPTWRWYSQHLREELGTFVEDAKGRFDHEAGKHSDSIITAAIGLQVIESMPPMVLLPPVIVRVPGVRYADDRERLAEPVRRKPWYAG